MKQVHILVVATRPHMPDVRGAALKQTMQEDFHLAVHDVRTAALYTMYTPRTPDDLEDARQQALVDHADLIISLVPIYRSHRFRKQVTPDRTGPGEG